MGLSRRAVLFLLLGLLCGQSGAQAEPGTGPRLWGALTPGAYGVGFRVLYRFDRSRTWKRTRGYEKPFTPDRNGRPIRIEIWYPASAQGQSSTMRFGDYLRPGAPAPFAEYEALVERHDQQMPALSVPTGGVPELLASPVAARRDAPRAAGRFPVILYFGGLNAFTTDNVVMAEFLASHGYMVASVPPMGRSEEDSSLSRKPTDLETAVRDMEFAWSVLRGEAEVDGGKVAVMGHSLGAIYALLFAMRNADVSAVAGLDGTYGFAEGAPVLTNFYGYAPEKMLAALLDLRKPAGEQGTVLDPSAAEALRYSDRYLVTVSKMHHSDFTSFAMIAQEFRLGNSPGYVDPSGWTRETGYRGFQNVCEIVRDFLDEKLRVDPGAHSRLLADVARADSGVLKHENALQPPPSAREFVELIAKGGFDAATAIVDRYRRETPGEAVVEENACNSLGYESLSAKRFPEALAAFRLCAYAHPASANAADSLGDGYLAAGQKELALSSYQHALELVNGDPTLKPEQKKGFAENEQRKIDQLTR